ncbi:beta-ketoacyl synthase chain length factor [Roseiterribacter gracilis]|uniref:Beta-ketoacyl synthase-like N-terminal domain-containing protein n=1 Tax=Roseiterribacter gracilis TaxID=2812848 RepID=A0A8S8X8E7_9PROT|nr:hypothetical protein TMPK1_04390 [Rhodospirillales bacterium TMPK1]
MRVSIDAIGLCGPGLDGWTNSAAILAGRAAYEATPPRIVAPDLLPSAERRRAVPSVRLALQVGQEALQASKADVATLPTVFTSSGGDGSTMHAILDTLAQPAREMSPTQFHNSVHNAPAGYWSIATGSHAPTTSLAAHDASFGAGLLEAASQMLASNAPVLLVAYDGAYPGPLNRVRPIEGSFGVALLLAPSGGIASLSIERVHGVPNGPALDDAFLERLRTHNPAARSLSLLTAIARGVAAEVQLQETANHMLRIAVAP